ncbi:tRNA (adenosine(37)-N6)-dimethylallyltransferase MiaA [Candidatus Gracilibacteria bacterium]|nr:tRNA (adenosine(37)-N6)-dimethylallyltransferase MiaA [Candidatus Gracilibacteria bacterium]NUJ98923.1 tRNA (adenosine(37)-N6)-dimethylallyltransferase MiaA [Candidatus Gracilibacteria bacterium]
MYSQEKLQNFLKQDGEKQKIIVIYGPTACGKTKMSLDIAEFLNTEIISTDSRQIFKYLNIGTGKIKQSEKRAIKHHMIDIIFPNEKYSVGEYKKEAEKIIQNLHSQKKIPILVGGTGLYIDSLIYDFDIPQVPADEILRKKLTQEAHDFGNDFVYKKLCEIDSDFAQTLHPNNLNYVIRALEIKLLSGKSKGEFKKEKVLNYDTLFLTPYNGEREKLYENINSRVENMLEEGLIEEIKNILGKGYKTTDFGLQTIGYSEIISFLDGIFSLQEAKELIQKNSRNYAKRQLTWFRKYEDKIF